MIYKENICPVKLLKSSNTIQAFLDVLTRISSVDLRVVAWWRIFLTESFRKHIGSNKSCSGSFPLQTSASSPLLINRLSQSYSNQEDFNLAQNEKEPEKTFLFPFILLMNFSDISLCSLYPSMPR